MWYLIIPPVSVLISCTQRWSLVKMTILPGYQTTQQKIEAQREAVVRDLEAMFKDGVLEPGKLRRLTAMCIGSPQERRNLSEVSWIT